MNFCQLYTQLYENVPTFSNVCLFSLSITSTWTICLTLVHFLH